MIREYWVLGAEPESNPCCLTGVFEFGGFGFHFRSGAEGRRENLSRLLRINKRSWSAERKSTADEKVALLLYILSKERSYVGYRQDSILYGPLWNSCRRKARRTFKCAYPKCQGEALFVSDKLTREEKAQGFSFHCRETTKKLR